MFPNLLKLAKIIPLFKSKNSKLIKNYRPISLLHLFSKLIEKMIKSRASKFITDNNILYRNQFGFRSGCSTSDAILHFTDDCVTALDNRQSTIAIFWDFSKAFDTVNKDIMLDKLDRLGFRGIIRDLFDSYLSDRRMYVEVNGCKSETKTLNIGLPQGSVSAPWLFNLYINDMHRSSDKLNFLHLADDTTIYLSGRDLTRLCEEVYMELCKVDDWLKANRLSLNIDKTFYMIITHNNYNETDINIIIRDVQLSRVTSTKFLGLTIDDRLSHGGHQSALYKQLSRVRGISYKLSSFLPPHVIKMLYYSLFHSRMVYGMSVWGGGGVTNISRIRKVNSSTLNIFTDKLSPNSPHPSHLMMLTVSSARPIFIDFRTRVEWNIFTIKSII